MESRQKKAATIELEKRDLRILRSLNRNARKSYRDIAKELHLSRKTVSSRIEEMEKAGVIQGYMPVIDAARIGYDIVAIINILFCTHEREVMDTPSEIANHPSVYAVLGSTGDWECIAMARFRNTRELDEFVKKTAALRNVERVCAQVILNQVKDEKRIHI